MRRTVTLLGLVVAGCASGPPTSSDRGEQWITQATAPLPRVHAVLLRVAVEYLPPEDPFAGPLHTLVQPRLPMAELGPHTGARTHNALRIESVEDPILVGRSAVPSAQPEERQTLWDWDLDELAKIEDPVERTTLRFVQNLMGEDRRRMRRELGMPIMGQRHLDLSSHLYGDSLDDQQSLEQQYYLSKNGARMLNRPLRRALRDTTFIHEFEVALEKFKKRSVPVSGAWQENQPRSLGWGKISLRLRATRFEDPVDMAYVNRGFRVASSQERLKASYSTPLGEGLILKVSTHHSYDDDHTNVRCDLVWRLDQQNSLSVIAGDNLDFLASTDSYSFFGSPMESSAGILLVVEHIF